MMSTPPFSSSFAVKPSPAPPTMIGRPSARVRRSRSCISAGVYRVAIVIPPCATVSRTDQSGGNDSFERDGAGVVVMAALLPAAPEHLLAQLGHQVGELRLVHVPVHEQDVEVRLAEVDRLEQSADEGPRAHRPLRVVRIRDPDGTRLRARPAERLVRDRPIDRAPPPPPAAHPYR